ncbi:hypothetical protein [Flavobacterium pectinovorum]|uniref:Uncharacterized protein n=1 Tax=Flavobacterium pectinovorum TaxID=29533 RepID=A0A502EMY9_9FLAO|nr:hypothetical protein [Flavobacterium pectinovorum]TPG38382.1 hypothetical protein EAH81_15730 [Flavobacterium pectinovorum]
MEIIDNLIDKRKDVIKQLEAIDTVLKLYGYVASDYKFNGTEAEPQSQNSAVFPSKATREKQILWIFENKITKACKLKDIQNVYNELRGKDDVNIDNTARKLKKESKLLFVQYNDKNLLSFWGLPTWIVNDDFKDEHKPDMEGLPDVVKSVVMIGEEKK